MDEVPNYMTFVIREDGEEYGVFVHGGKIKKFLTVFPSDLFHYQTFHDTLDQAIFHLSLVWTQVNQLYDPVAFLTEVIKQRSHHAIMVNDCGHC